MIKITDIQNYLKTLGLLRIPHDYYDKIAMWEEWYKGKSGTFHSYTQYNGKHTIKRSRATLSMAKRVCEEWANLLLNEKVVFSFKNGQNSKLLNKVFETNNFYTNAAMLTELTFALGTGAFVEYGYGENTVMDFVGADMIYPLSWHSGIIDECTFASRIYKNGTRCIYINIHEKQGGKYSTRNIFIDDYGKEIKFNDISDGEMCEAKRFQIIRPNIVNSISFRNPMGISVFADSIDILKSIDLIYDSYQNEFRLGKKRILVPAGMAQLQSANGGMKPIFDDNDTEFYAMSDKSLTDLKEINMTLRTDAHETALQRNLDLLSVKCGLGCDRFKYDSKSIKTATQVISEKSELYQNIKKHEKSVEFALKELAFGITGEVPEIKFDDSIIQDTESIAQRALQEFDKGIITKEEYIKRVYGGK